MKTVKSVEDSGVSESETIRNEAKEKRRIS